ncbi:hypothetical protein BT96DRAFT_990697 [Gymnopus androsaceus JB14]|uniref:Uncharacterized protein n=1 Tax=Gymnopus androsaceus JB14 TaxID=1447944 RepID=A0A6A4I2E0_9AGAR|nr:hypothetical protein BT96DRAFT_990697 [Gymnopus androsaceus JB14]
MDNPGTAYGYDPDGQRPYHRLPQYASDAYHTPISAPQNHSSIPRHPNSTPTSFPRPQMVGDPGRAAYIQNQTQSSMPSLSSFPQSISNTFQNVVPNVRNFFQRNVPPPVHTPAPPAPLPTTIVHHARVPTVIAPMNPTPQPLPYSASAPLRPPTVSE